MVAVVNGHTDVVHTLLSHDAVVNTQNKVRALCNYFTYYTIFYSTYTDVYAEWCYCAYDGYSHGQH